MDINQRILDLQQRTGLSKQEFAMKIGVSQASLSHLQSGRNKASLDLVLSILQTFEDVNSDWLLFGRGEIYKSREGDAKTPGLLKLIDEITVLNEMNYNSLSSRIEILKQRITEG